MWFVESGCRICVLRLFQVGGLIIIDCFLLAVGNGEGEFGLVCNTEICVAVLVFDFYNK